MRRQNATAMTLNGRAHAAAPDIRKAANARCVNGKARGSQKTPGANPAWQLILQRLPAMVWTTDENLRITSVGGSDYGSLAQHPGGAIGLPIDKCFAHCGISDAFVRAHHKSLNGKRTKLQQIWGRKAYQIYLEPLASDKNIEGCVGLAIDITPRNRRGELQADPDANPNNTERKHAKNGLAETQAEISGRLAQSVDERRQIEQAVRSTQNRVLQLAASIDSAMWIYDVRHDKAIYLSPGFEEIWKVSPNTALQQPGHPMLRAAHPDDLEKLQAAIATQCQGHSTNDELRIRHPDGQIRWIRARAFPIVGRRGNVDRIAGIAEDITIRRNEEETERRNDRLAMLGSFSAGIAHEVNNPLGAALLSIQCALRMIPGEQSQHRQCLEHALSSIHKCSDVVKSLLRFCREEPARHSDVNFHDVLEFAESVCRAYAAEHQCELCLPKKITRMSVVGSAVELEMVMVNLLRNAIEAGGKRVEVLARRVERQLRIVVRDDGHGINRAHVARICDPFFTTRRTEGGAGLGLSIVHAIVHEHGGSLQFVRRERGGTDVVIKLPLKSKGQSNHEKHAHNGST